MSFTHGDSYTLDTKKSDEALVRILNDLAASRKVPQGIQILDTYKQLADTGLIHLQDSNVSFWHRAFQEYLASFQIGERVQSGQIQLNRVIKVPKWESVLPSMVHQVEDPDALIRDLLSHNVFTAGRAIIECDLRSGSVYEMTVECLIKRCESQQRAIRQIAVNLLRQIEGDYVGEKFRELLESEQLRENCEFEHIRKIALIEVARRKITNARDFVYAHLDWRSYTHMDWISQEVHAGAAVIEALSWFDDQESQQHIVDRWIRSIDFPTREACRDALIRIANRGTLDSNIKQTLLEMVSNSYQTGQPPLNVVPVNGAEKVDVDYWGLELVLIAIHDADLALQLIAVLAAADDRGLRTQCIIQILKTFNEPEFIDALVQQIDLHRNNPLLCERFLDVLSEIEGEIPIEIFSDFAQDELPTTAKAYAIRGLGNFSFDSIKGTVPAAIHPPSYEKLVEITNEHLIDQVLQTHHDTEVIQAITDLANLPSLEDSSRVYLHQLVAKADDATELLRQMAKTDVSRDVRWSIVVTCQHLSSKTLQKVIPHLLSPLPYEYLLTNDSPCNYARIQEEAFQVLAKHRQIALLVKAENRPKFLYNISAEILFDVIRRDKIYEMEPFVVSFIERQTGVHQVHIRRMVVEAAWVLADLGNAEKAQEVINQIMERFDLSVSGNDWILGDILKGIHLLPSDYAIALIEKTWSNIQESDSVLIPLECVEALERIGTQEALDVLARIALETAGQQEYLLVSLQALRAIHKVSPVGREEWLIRFLQQNHQDRHVVLRVIDMLGMTGNRQALPIIQQYFENHPSEKTRFVAFWAIHNIYKSTNEVWYNGEEGGCV